MSMRSGTRRQEKQSDESTIFIQANLVVTDWSRTDTVMFGGFLKLHQGQRIHNIQPHKVLHFLFFLCMFRSNTVFLMALIYK